MPGVCQCKEGRTGGDCTECKPLVGCVYGGCEGDIPDTCECESGYTGALCDQPDCSGSPLNDCNAEDGKGFCVFLPDHDAPECICKPGYEGNDCGDCVTYPGCPDYPGDCVEPWDCICPPTEPQDWPCGIGSFRNNVNITKFHHAGNIGGSLAA